MRDLRRRGSVADEPALSAAIGTVSATLWSERETLELLLFTLTVERFVLSGGSARWLNRADADVRAAIERLRTSEVIRAAEVESLAATLGMPVGTSLAELAAGAPEPWPLVLTDHRTALRALVAEVEAVAAENRQLLESGFDAIRETLDNLDNLGTSVSAYDDMPHPHGFISDGQG